MALQLNFRGTLCGETTMMVPHMCWIVVCAVALSLGCSETNKLSPPDNPLPELHLNFGDLSPVEATPVQVYAALNQPGTIVHEEISSVLAAEGIPPVRISVNAKARWGGSVDAPTLEVLKLDISPANAPIGDDVKKDLETGAPPQNLPLGPLTLLDTPATSPASPIRQPLESTSFVKELKIQGTWVCDRTDGKNKSGATARKVTCKLEDGIADQAHSNESRIRKRNARLLGSLSAVRATTDKKGHKVSIEEIRLHLSAWSQSPRPTQIELRYHRKACLNEKNCPIIAN